MRNNKKRLIYIINTLGWCLMIVWTLMTLPLFNFIWSLNIAALGTYENAYLHLFDNKLVIQGNLYYAIIFIGVLFAKAGFLLSMISEKDFA